MSTLKTSQLTSADLTGFHNTLNARRSIRVFDRTPLPDDALAGILKDATLAPTSSNLQTFELYAVRNTEKKAKLAAACMGQPAASTAGDLVVVVARPDLWKRNRDLLLGEMTKSGQKLPESVTKYYNKLIPFLMRRDPFGILNLVRRVTFFALGFVRPIVRTPVSDADMRVYGATQAALVAQTLMLAATSRGYDTCPMGGFDEKRVKALLGLPCQAEVSMVIAIGNGKPEGLYGPRFRISDQYLIHTIN
jgi:nitroreductase